MLHPLAAEVVDHQRAAVALQLQRGLADAGRGVDVTSSCAMVSSPPATIVGRRMRTQRLSICRWSSRPLPGSSGTSSWFTGSNSRMISPSTPMARGIQIVVAEGGR